MRRIPLPEDLAAAMEIHRLDLHLGEEPMDALSVLTPAERMAAGRFRCRADRVRFAATRAALRRLLSHRLDCPPSAIDIVPGPYGKPQVRGVRGRPVGGAPLFNVSHSGNVALIAMGESARLSGLGVDVERCDPDIDPLSLADAACTGYERACLRAAADPLQVFYLIWVAKEAALKAVGVGISDHLHAMSIELTPGPEAGARAVMPDWAGLRVRAVEAPAGYVAAAAWLNQEELL